MRFRKTCIFVLAMASFVFLPSCTTTPCGNGAIDEGEECDGSALAEASCASLGFSYGELACNASCAYETSGCVLDPAWKYAIGPHGELMGDVIENLGFDPANTAAQAIAGDDNRLTFSDFWALNEQHGGSMVGLLVVGVAGWCAVCATEAPDLEAIYQEYVDRGIMLLGLVVQDNHGDPSDVADAASYAARYDWTFPTVAGELDDAYWQTYEGGSLPINLFIDLRSMRLSGRMEGPPTAKLIRGALEELVAGVTWSEDGGRIFDPDCAPGSGTEVEPNGFEDPPTAASVPATVSGTICPPMIAEGLMYDEDYFNLGELEAGTTLVTTMTATGSGPLWPNIALLGLDASETLFYGHSSITRMTGGTLTQQWIIPDTARYLVGAMDAREQCWGYYPSYIVPDEHACCEGGPTFEYSLQIDTFTLAATEPELEVGAERHEALGVDALKVYPLAAVNGNEYTITLRADDASALTVSEALYDSVTGTLLDYSDTGTMHWTAESNNELWVVVSYVWAAFKPDPPLFRLLVE